jgi:hypothetical protein
MSSKLRNDKTCQNCGYAVDVAYCSNCGQKNTETRQPFHHLFAHFVEDLTHYDGAFWKSILHLMFRPAQLTREYLVGKRQTYVPPVKLYIFISFVTFFILAVLPEDEIDKSPKLAPNEKIISSSSDINIRNRHFDSPEDLRKFLESKEGKELPYFEEKMLRSAYHYSTNDLDMDDVLDSYQKFLPKVLFLYMPIFAFWLWLLHGKKKWCFFDHSIFTLHYFSFLLLSITIVTLAVEPFYLINDTTGNAVAGWSMFFLSMYMFFYFFRSHRRMYGEGRAVSRLKSLLLFFINIILIMFVLTAAFFYVLQSMH